MPLNLKKRFEVDGEDYAYALTTRGYYYELAEPDRRSTCCEGRVMGEVKKPITAYVRKPGVDYGDDLGVGDAAASTAIARARARTGARPLTRARGGCARAGRRVRVAARRAPRPTTRRPPSRARPPSGPATELDVTLDPDAPAHRGPRAPARRQRRRGAAVDRVASWLYPNALAERSPALNDVSFHWLYPGGFSPGAIDAANLRVDGAPAPVTIDDVPLVGRRAIASAPLADAAGARRGRRPSTSTSTPASRAATARSAATAPAAG